MPAQAGIHDFPRPRSWKAWMAARFKPLADALTAAEGKINAELIAAQGKPMDTGGYYLPDTTKASAAMRPSETLNAALAAL